MHVLVVGAGIIGASISRSLALRGAKVTVLEAAPAPAAGATGKSWAWLNANAKQPLHYRDLNLRSMQLWQQQHGSLATFCGALMLHDERPAGHDPAYPSVHIPPGPQLQQQEPGLSPELAHSCQHAKLYPLEGWCDPAAATATWLEEACAAGASVLYGQQVEGISAATGTAAAVTARSSSSNSNAHRPPQPQPQPQQQQEQQEQQPQNQQLSADVVVLAAGVGTPSLCAQLGYTLPLLHKPAAIVMTSPLPDMVLRHMLVTDTVFILQRTDGRFLLGETQPTAAANTDTSASNAARILQQAAAAVPALCGVTVEGIHVGYRPYPADGYPVVGWLPGCDCVYVAVTHSGMTLAPLIGQLAAEEVIARVQQHKQDGGSGSSNGGIKDNGSISSSGSPSLAEAAALLAPYRPDRDFAAAASDGKLGLSWAATLQPSKQ